MKKAILIFISILTFATVHLFGQDTDSLKTKFDTTQQVTNSKLTKSPAGAIWRSLALPGWGQYYVESYWKAPIFFAGAGTLVGFIFWNNSRYQNEADYLTTIDATHADYQITKLRREYYRDNRDKSAFFLLVVYLLSAVDAYTGAHLYDFSVDEKVSLGYNFTNTGSVVLDLRIKF